MILKFQQYYCAEQNFIQSVYIVMSHVSSERINQTKNFVILSNSLDFSVTYVIVLAFHSFLHVILLSLQFDDKVPHLLSLGAEARRADAVNIERLDADGEGDLLLLGQLLTGLAQLALGRLDVGELQGKVQWEVSCVSTWRWRVRGWQKSMQR